MREERVVGVDHAKDGTHFLVWLAQLAPRRDLVQFCALPRRHTAHAQRYEERQQQQEQEPEP